MKRNRIKAGVFAIVLLLSAMLFTGCGTETEILRFDQSHLKESSSKDHYAYGTLTDEEKTVYDQIVHAIEAREESVLVSTKDTQVLEKAYMAMRYDYCDFFWTDSYEYELYSNNQKEPVKLYFKPVYNCTEAEQEQYQTQIDAEAERMLADLPENATDYEKVYYVYRTLIQETSYSEEAQNNQNIVSTFVTHETVCQGYAYGAQYLLNRIGIPCITVCGTSEGANHSWNLIQMDGDYYYMDVTWGEMEYWQELQVPPESASGTENREDVINYSYLGVSDKDTSFMENHIPLDYVPMPECTATKDNYYVHEGLYFDKWDKDAVGAVIRKAYDAGDNTVCIKFATKELYDTAFSYIIDEDHWADYCDVKRITYVDQFDTNVFMLDFSPDTVYSD